MGFLIFVVIVIGAAWFVHKQFGFAWGSIFGTIGVALATIVGWAFKSDHDNSKRIGEIHDTLNRMSTNELRQYRHDNRNPPENRQIALNIIRHRTGLDE